MGAVVVSLKVSVWNLLGETETKGNSVKICEPRRGLETDTSDKSVTHLS